MFIKSFVRHVMRDGCYALFAFGVHSAVFMLIGSGFNSLIMTDYVSDAGMKKLLLACRHTNNYVLNWLN